jgi:CSLREA domain-containing protein
MSSIPGSGMLRPSPKSFHSRSHSALRSRLPLAVPVALLVAGFLTLSEPKPASAQGVIFVTSLEDKVNGVGGCSLQEAIYAANRGDNRVPISYKDADGSEILVPTQCQAGQGDHRIILPVQAVFQLNRVVLDASNPFGATATPMVTSKITIEANGSTLEWIGSSNARAFTVASTGNLTLLDIYIRDFHVKGGDGGSGGGGGLGAGGAIYVKGEGSLNIERSTFSGNRVVGGNGAGTAFGGGGGGLGGRGGSGPNDVFFAAHGGGGGGAIGNGIGSTSGFGGGGGTIFDAGLPIGPPVGLPAFFPFEQPGFMCGGRGGVTEEDGVNAPCAGGGGGGGGDSIDLLAGNGGNGNYGGGGGGGGLSGSGDRANGGNGGFGGGGGGGWQDVSGGCGSGSSGGDGGICGGGGAGPGGQIFGGPGHGGAYGGDASCNNGGGGAAFGGAIFSDGGIVTIENSTFSGNSVTRGLGAGANSARPAADGGDGGGAIFAVGGGLFIHHSTISGNQSTNQVSGILLSSIVIFELQNTIISGNGTATDRQCLVAGATELTGSGNAISSNNSNCPGIVTTNDPQVGPLELNSPGITPTMAISKFSSAFDAADPSTSLKIDQRGFPRPQENGFDIGAFELCISNGILLNCSIPPEINPNPPGNVNLTIHVSPLGTGTTIPVPRDYPEPLNSVVVVAAIPNPGYGFVNWTGGVADPTNPSSTVIIDQGKTITANFAPLNATMFGNIIAKSGASNARVWTLSLLDNGPGAANSVTIHDFTLTQTFGAACTPVLMNAASFPLQLGNLGPSQAGTNTVTLDFAGCAASARFTAKFTYSANNGAVSGFVTRTNQYQ